MTYALALRPAHFYQRRLLCGARAAALWFGDVRQVARAARPSPPIHPRDRPSAIFGKGNRRIEVRRAADAAI